MNDKYYLRVLNVDTKETLHRCAVDDLNIQNIRTPKLVDSDIIYYIGCENMDSSYPNYDIYN